MDISFTDEASSFPHYVPSYLKGKALLVITKLDSEYVPFEVYPFIQTCNGNEVALDYVFETFSLLETDTLPLPHAAYKLEVGETVRVSVVYQFEFTVDYFGESYVDLFYHKETVLRKQIPKYRYLTKGQTDES